MPIRSYCIVFNYIFQIKEQRLSPESGCTWHLPKSQGQAVRDTQLARPPWRTQEDAQGHGQRELSHNLWLAAAPAQRLE